MGGGVIDLGVDMSPTYINEKGELELKKNLFHGLQNIDGLPEPITQKSPQKEKNSWGIVEYFAIAIIAIMVSFLAYKKLV